MGEAYTTRCFISARVKCSQCWWGAWLLCAVQSLAESSSIYSAQVCATRGGGQLLEKGTWDKVGGLIPAWALHLRVGLDDF